MCVALSTGLYRISFCSTVSLIVFPSLGPRSGNFVLIFRPTVGWWAMKQSFLAVQPSVPRPQHLTMELKLPLCGLCLVSHLFTQSQVNKDLIMLLVLAISYFGPPHFHLGNEYFWGPNSDPAIVGGEEEIYLLFSFLFTFLRCVVCVLEVRTTWRSQF